MAEKRQEEIKKAAETTLSLMGVKGTVSVTEDKESDALILNLETDSNGIVIGRHGETLEALQTVLGAIYNQGQEEWQRVLVDVGDWRKRREETVQGLVLKVADEVRSTGEPRPVYNLTPAERRVAHMVLADDPNVQTKSEGEGRERHLVIEPKTK